MLAAFCLVASKRGIGKVTKLAGNLLPNPSFGKNTEAVVTVDTDAHSVSYSRMIFGGFIEHFHRQIYGGLFEPGSGLSDERGFRKDVIAAMTELRLSIVRWPGGCFASGYHWKDGVGKIRKEKRGQNYFILFTIKALGAFLPKTTPFYISKKSKKCI